MVNTSTLVWFYEPYSLNGGYSTAIIMIICAIAIDFIILPFFGYLCTNSKNNGTRSQRYLSFRKSSLQPPNWFFGAIWPILYACFAIGWFLILRWNDTTNFIWITANVIHIIVSLLLAFWSYVAFYLGFWRESNIVLLSIVFLHGLSIILVGAYGEWISFGLWSPLFVWCAFAFYLNNYIVQNNTDMI